MRANGSTRVTSPTPKTIHSLVDGLQLVLTSMPSPRSGDFTAHTMDLSFPYTRYACPCSGTASAAPISFQNKRSSDDGDGDPEDGTFNPHEPRANYSLYPMDHLMFCDECNQIRCPKCTTEDMLSWFCPTCLFEVPTSGVKSEGNR